MGQGSLGVTRGRSRAGAWEPEEKGPVEAPRRRESLGCRWGGPHTPVVWDRQFSKHLQDLDQALRLQLHRHGLLWGPKRQHSGPGPPLLTPQSSSQTRGPRPDPQPPAENVGPTRPAAEPWSRHSIPLRPRAAHCPSLPWSPLSVALWSWDISVPRPPWVPRGRGVIPGCPGRPAPARLGGPGGMVPPPFGVSKHERALRRAAHPARVHSRGISAISSLRGRGHAITVVGALGKLGPQKVLVLSRVGRLASRPSSSDLPCLLSPGPARCVWSAEWGTGRALGGREEDPSFRIATPLPGTGRTRAANSGGAAPRPVLCPGPQRTANLS